MNAMNAIVQSEEAPMSLPEMIKSARAEKGMTQKELAEKSGVSLSMLKQLETGRAEPSMQKFKQIALVLELSADDIWAELTGGTLTDEKLRLSVTTETMRFLTEKASTPDLEKVRQLVSDLSASDESRGESKTVQNIAPSAVQILSDLIVSKGLKSRKLPIAIEAAQDELEGFDADDLEVLADEYGVDLDGDAEGHEDHVAARIICAALYQKDLMAQPLDELEIIRGWLEEELTEGNFIFSDLPDELASKGWFGDTEEAEKRLRQHMPMYLVKFAIERKFLPQDYEN